jgi:hypothetical protein
MVNFTLTLCAALIACGSFLPGGAAGETSPYAAWKLGPSTDPSFFPLAVWLQDPSNAEKYKAAGINVYVGLWNGPTDEELAALKGAGMKVVCSQNECGLAHLDDRTIVGWMHGDEPDNAQSLGEGKGYGPPIPPEKIIADYRRIRAADPSRPVFLNLGQGVAWDGWYGRGVRTNHPEDYLEYCKGGDIFSFDIYPVASPDSAVKGKLWYVPFGVERLGKWTNHRKPVWNCIECSRINTGVKATPAQVRAEVWMSLIRGSRGIIYFVHEWEPKFNEHALLDDPEMLAEVTRLNGSIAQLAPALNSPELSGAVKAESSNPDVPLDCTARRLGKDFYIFSVCMRDGAANGRFRIKGLPSEATAEVLGEDRTITVKKGVFEDAFGPWEVHLYRIRAVAAPQEGRR